MSNEQIIKLINYKSCASTNDELHKLALKSAPAGTVVTADFQTNGKGTKGRSFHSPSKTGIYMSVLLRNIKSEDMLHITPLAAVIVSQVLDEICGVDTRIKWVNDIYINRKKVCGILTQAQSNGKKVDFIIVGIGINLFCPQGGFPDEIKDIAGYVLEEYNEETRQKVIEEVAKRLVKASGKVDDTKFRDEIYEYYTERQITI